MEMNMMGQGEDVSHVRKVPSCQLPVGSERRSIQADPSFVTDDGGHHSGSRSPKGGSEFPGDVSKWSHSGDGGAGSGVSHYIEMGLAPSNNEDGLDAGRMRTSERLLDCEPANRCLESTEGCEDVFLTFTSNGAVNTLSSPLKTSAAVSFGGMDVSPDKGIFARPKTSDDYPVQQASTVRPPIDRHQRSSQKEPYAPKTEAGQDGVKENDYLETGSKVSRPSPSGSGSLFSSLPSLHRPSFSTQRSTGADHKHRRTRISNMSEESLPFPKLTHRRINSDEPPPSPILIHSRMNSEGGVVPVNQRAGANFSPYRLYSQQQQGSKGEFCPPPFHPTSKPKEGGLRQDEDSDVGRKHQHHHYHHNQHHRENSSGLSLGILATAKNADTTNGKSAKVGGGPPATAVAPTMTKATATLAQTRSPSAQVEQQQQQAYPKFLTPSLWQRSPPSFSPFQFSPTSFSTLGSSSPTCQYQQGKMVQGGQHAYSTGSRMKQAHLTPRYHQQKSQQSTLMDQLTPQRKQGDHVPHSRPHFHRIPSTQSIAGFVGEKMQPPPPTPHQPSPQDYPPHPPSLQYYHHHHHQGHAQAHRHQHHHPRSLTHCYYPLPQSSALTHDPTTRNSPPYPVQYAPAPSSSFLYGGRKKAGISNASPKATALERRPSTPSQKQPQRLSGHNRNPVEVSATSQKSKLETDEILFFQSKEVKYQGKNGRGVSFLGPVPVQSVQSSPPGVTAEMRNARGGWNAGRGITTGVQTLITAIGVGDRDMTIWPSNCVQQQQGHHQMEKNRRQTQSETPALPKHHHHRMDSFSSISTVTGSNLFHNEPDEFSQPHPLSLSFGGLQGQSQVLPYPHNQIQNSATTFHNSLTELETNGDTFLHQIGYNQPSATHQVNTPPMSSSKKRKALYRTGAVSSHLQEGSQMKNHTGETVAEEAEKIGDLATSWSDPSQLISAQEGDRRELVASDQAREQAFTALPPPSASSRSYMIAKTSKRIRRKCNVANCPNRVVQGGLCISHGAKRKQCSHPGCIKNVKKAGLCSTHGPERKRCDVEGCGKVAVQGGRCIAHGARKKLCSVEDCTKQAILGGMCKKHHDRHQPILSGRDRSRQGGEGGKQQHHTAPTMDQLLSNQWGGAHRGPSSSLLCVSIKQGQSKVALEPQKDCPVLEKKPLRHNTHDSLQDHHCNHRHHRQDTHGLLPYKYEQENYLQELPPWESRQQHKPSRDQQQHLPFYSSSSLRQS